MIKTCYTKFLENESKYIKKRVKRVEFGVALITTAFRSKQQKDCTQFKDTLIYTESFQPSRLIEQDPVSNKGASNDQRELE